jgi:uncharacterized membrane protein (UPF0127 family)
MPNFAGFRLFLGFLAVLTALCGPVFADTALPVEKLVVETEQGEMTFNVEVAATDAHRARGLMFREEMAADAGMLFLFDTEGDRYFWMKNTPLSLDIIFIGANGVIVNIANDTTPFSEKIVASTGPAKYVLEVLAGTSKRLGIKAGDKVRSASMG